MTSLPLGVIAVSLLLAFLVHRYILSPTLFSPLASIPNAHWSSPFSRLWILALRWNRRENKTLHALHQRLGPVIRLGPHEVSINSIEGVRTVYQGGFEKPVWYSVFDNYGVPCMFSMRRSAAHSARKRLISNVYSKSYIQSSSPATSQAQSIIYNRLLPILEDSISSTQIPHGIDIYSVLMAATMDFIAGYIFGLDKGTNFLQDKAYRDHFFELYKARNDYGFYDQELPTLTRFCRKIGIPFCPAWVDEANRELGEWCLRLCDGKAAGASSEKYEEIQSANQSVVYHALITGLDKEATTTSGQSNEQKKDSTQRLTIASELFDHVLAGQETAGIALAYLTWRLSQSLGLQNKLRAELLSLSPNMRRTNKNKNNTMPDPKALDALPLLNAIISETLRLHAPIPGSQPRETPQSGCTIGGFYIPGGVRISAAAYSLHRDEWAFEDPEKWDYTRWFPPQDWQDKEAVEKFKQRIRQFWAFSSGGRMCIGSNFAMHEMKLIICAIYSNYTSHIVDDDGMEDQSDGYTSRPGKERLFLIFERV
ncbi:hypothetical protein V8F20_002389 [Naviculisporaceae sp. PSN 640]